MRKKVNNKVKLGSGFMAAFLLTTAAAHLAGGKTQEEIPRYGNVVTYEYYNYGSFEEECNDKESKISKVLFDLNQKGWTNEVLGVQDYLNDIASIRAELENPGYYYDKDTIEGYKFRVRKDYSTIMDILEKKMRENIFVEVDQIYPGDNLLEKLVYEESNINFTLDDLANKDKATYDSVMKDIKNKLKEYKNIKSQIKKDGISNKEDKFELQNMYTLLKLIENDLKNHDVELFVSEEVKKFN